MFSGYGIVDLIEEGNTVILIEHNLTMMTQADWLIDIGPYAGDKGRIGKSSSCSPVVGSSKIKILSVTSCVR
jgi:excinuclease UvrABC ATPase subunit